MSIDSRTALVTGGSRGIGAAICRRLAVDGAAVAVNFRHDEEAAGRVVDEITAAGGRALAIQADVSDPDQARALVKQTIGDLGTLDVLVNNAGVSRDSLIYSMEPADLWHVMRVNFGSVFHCTQAALPYFMSRGDGVIVNVSSVMGERGWTGQANYAASKGAVNAFTRCAALEGARFGVRVNAVLPGFTSTELVAQLAEGDTGKAIKRQIPVRAFCSPAQVAEVVRFLAGPESAYVTGSLVTVDGGAMATLGLGGPG